MSAPAAAPDTMFRTEGLTKVCDSGLIRAGTRQAMNACTATAPA